MTNLIQQNNYPQMFAFLKEEKLTNVTLTAEGKIVQAHKLVLAAASKYFEDLFTILGEKHPVIVLKDVSVKYLLLILEYIYCGRVDLEPEEVEEFKKVAESMKIKVSFNVAESELVQKPVVSPTIAMSQEDFTDVSSTNLECDDSMEPSFDDLMESSGASGPLAGQMTLSIASVKSLSSHPKLLEKNSPDSFKTGPPPKRIKIRKRSSPIKIKISSRPTISSKIDWPVGQCIYCDCSIREKDRNYHQKFCWKNNNRIVSDCTLCPKKYQFPPKLRQHLMKCHPGTSTN